MAALVWVSWTWRAPVAVGFLIVGVALVIAGALAPDPAGMAMVETVALIVPGAMLLAASFVPAWRRWAYVNGLLGHLCLYGAVAVGVQTEDAALVAMAALVATHTVEAVAVQRGTSPFIAEAARLAGPGRAMVEAAPAAIAAVAAMPLAMLAGRRAPWLQDERARSSLMLGALAWAYTAAVAWLRKPARWLLVVLAYLSVFGAIAVAFPSRPASLVAVTSAALVTFALSLILRRPGGSMLSWILALVGVVLFAAQLGVDQADLYRPLYAATFALVVAGGGLNAARDRGSGITDRWSVPAVLVGLVGLPVSLAFSIAAGSWIWALAAGAALAVAFVGWAAGTGGVAVAVALYAGIAYADALSFKVNIFSDQPIYWMFFAATLVLASGILPGRSEWRLLHDASPGALLSGLASAAMAVTLDQQTGSGALVMALSSLLLAVVWILRRNDNWLHAGIATLIWASAIAGGGWLPAGLAIAGLIVTAMAEIRHDRLGGVVYPWVGVGLWVWSYAFFAGWVGWGSVTVTVVTVVVGAVVSGGALGVWLSGWTRPWVARWLWPAAAAGQVGLLGAVVYADATLVRSDVLVAFAVVFGIEALLVGIYATVRLSPVTSWAAAGLAALAYGFFAAALLTDPVDLLRVTGPIGAALLAGWAVLTITSRSDRLILWRWPALALAQGALVTASVAAAIGLDNTAASGALAAITAWEALLFTLVATTTITPVFAFLSTAFVLASYGALIRWLELDGARVVLAWMVLTVVGLAVATSVGHLRRSVRISMWVWPLHVVAVATSFLTVLSTADHLAPADARLTVAVVIAALGAHLLANRSEYARYVPVEVAAATAFVVAGALAATRLEPQVPWTFTVLLAMALVAAIAAPLVDRFEAGNARAALILVIGYGIIPIVAATVLWGLLASEVGYLLIVTGGALAAYGVATRKLHAFEGAGAIWLSSILILLNDRFGMELHATVVLVSVVLLAVLDVERYRHRRDEQPQPEPLRILEWIAMTVPLLLAVSTTFDSLVYALVLTAEGLALIVWGGLTRVRRRALVGLAAVTTALVLGVMIPVLREVLQGLSGGTWLAIGAAAAFVMIAAGSLIEKQRVRIGERLSRWEEILESWE
ncbi:MAG: hypothetical protein U9R51_01405 [Actinomycetota bacterium]|nr:hypothetical protein [Actinomycetota bacterium]